MHLEHFISESLIQIYAGIETAQNKISRIPEDKREEKHFVGYINPSAPGGRKDEIRVIEFDIAVTASSTKSNTDQSGIKADILVARLGMGLGLSEEKSRELSNSSITRIKFSIPMIYHSMPIPHPGNEQ